MCREHCLLARFSSLRADNVGRFIFRKGSNIRGVGSIDDFKETVVLSFNNVPTRMFPEFRSKVAQKTKKQLIHADVCF